MIATANLSPSDWASLIADNGPTGLLLLVVFVLLGVAIQQRGKAPNNPVNQGIYVYTWVMIGVLIVVSAVIWGIVHMGRPAMLKGSIDNLPLNYLVRGGNNSDDLSFYTRPESDGPNGAKLRFHWLAMAQHPFKGVLSIIVYTPSDPSQTASNSYGRELLLPVAANSDGTPLTIVYAGDDSYSIRTPDGTQKPLKVNAASLTLPLPSASGDGIVYAATNVDPAAMKARLEAPDPITRRQARDELANAGLDAMPFIDHTLADPNSSPAALFGILSALALMQNGIPSESHLDGPALMQLMADVSQKNRDIANAAQAYVNKRGAFQVHQALTSWIAAARQQNPNQRLSDYAIAALDFMYLYGINEKDAYGGHRDTALFNASLQAFQLGWDDRRFAEPDQQVYFAEALYGWGMLLADRAVLDRKPGAPKDPEAIKAAQAKFAEFLKAAAPQPRNPRYPYQNQLLTARAYLVNPTLKLY